MAAEAPLGTPSKLERLNQLRNDFRLLAAGDPGTAMRSAKQLADATERETALLTLVTEWTQGELSSPAQRARAILAYGLEAGLGLELARNPELAALWAGELTAGRGRFALLEAAATGLLETNPTAAFALGEQLPQAERASLSQALLTSWAQNNTEAALQWVSKLPDPAWQNSALESIRNVAPVGIGAAITLQNGYPIIQDLVPNGPAQAGGQLRPGDRILGLAQDGTTFVDARGMSLENVVKMIRGAPGTPLHLQIQRADAAPNTPPQTIWIMRDQVKFKR